MGAGCRSIFRQTNLAIGSYNDLLTIIRKCKLKGYKRFIRSNRLTKTILQGCVPRGMKRGRQRGRRMTKSERAQIRASVNLGELQEAGTDEGSWFIVSHLWCLNDPVLCWTMAGWLILWHVNYCFIIWCWNQTFLFSFYYIWVYKNSLSLGRNKYWLGN